MPLFTVLYKLFRFEKGYLNSKLKNNVYLTCFG